MTVSKLTCPECGKVLKPAKPLAAGKKVKCRACQKPFVAEPEAEAEAKGTAIQEPTRRVAVMSGVSPVCSASRMDSRYVPAFALLRYPSTRTAPARSPNE